MELLKSFSWMLLLLCMAGLPFLHGKGACTVLYRKQDGKIYVADYLLIGWMMQIGLAEAAHLAAVFLKRSFSDTVLLFGVGEILVTVAAGGILFWKRRAGHSRAHTPYTTFQIVLFLLFTVLAVRQILAITAMGAVYQPGDLTAETVESILKTNAVYQVNPLTGHAYTGGVPLRIKILCLPTLYGALCRIFGFTAMEMVWKVIPVAVLVGSYLAFFALARTVFPGAEGREKRMLFLVIVAVIFFVGDYLYGMDGFGLLHSGFRGVTIRNTVLLPYVFSLILRRKWKLVVLCILAEACIVWTLYGMGACLFVLAGMTAVRIRRGSGRRLKTGEEA